jgi:uncharacterized sulfatase
MDRRAFLKNATASGAALAAAGLLGNHSKAQGGPPPNILFILVDELRYWRVPFPGRINTVGEFLREFMHNTYELLWQPGVKFAGHYTARTACSPARGTLVTGLYTQQSWMLATILAKPGQIVSRQPVLNRAYPTYGRLLQNAGYQTPYIGKWHLSIPHRSPDERLEAYGLEGMTFPDPTGANLQGTIGRHGRGARISQRQGYCRPSREIPATAEA